MGDRRGDAIVSRRREKKKLTRQRLIILPMVIKILPLGVPLSMGWLDFWLASGWLLAGEAARQGWILSQSAATGE